MKTERLNVLTTPEFKRYLETEADREGVSISELVRIRCGETSDEERLLKELTAELKASMHQAQTSLKIGLKEAQKVIAELQNNRGSK